MVRNDGDEKPKLGRVAMEYYVLWKAAHPTDSEEDSE